MAERRHARNVAQRRLDPEPDTPPPREEAKPPEAEPTAVSPSASAAPRPRPPEELPGGSGAELRERQRRWLAERARFEEAVRRAAGSEGGAPEG